MQLTERQARLLRAVVRQHQKSRRPVGSKALVSSGVVRAASSTVRYELGRLEELGLLEHPHTSAGRIPTDAGYRWYVNDYMHREGPATSHVVFPLLQGDVQARVEDALSAVTRALADATELLALATVPRTEGTAIRHIEVLQLQPHVVVAVIITETGDVTRHIAMLDEPADPGLVKWAGSYLNERVTGMVLGQNLLRSRLEAPELSESERAMLSALSPAFTELVGAADDVHLGGTSTLVSEMGDDIQQIVDLISVLDERRRLLGALRSSMAGGRVAVTIGCENALPELQPLSIVGASYGLPARPLGVIGVIGPRHMDYPRAIGAVHHAADMLNTVVDGLYAH